VLVQEADAIYRQVGTPTPAIAVMVNRVKTARELFARLDSEPGRDFDVKLVTGRSRPLDRDRLANWLLTRVRSGRTPCPDDRGLIVVSTQALEVGADLDFQGLVTECASLDALRQRFGRLDRLGNFQHACATIVGSNDDSDDDPVYGRALIRTWQWLCSVGQELNGSTIVDFSIASMEALLRSADTRSMRSAPREMLQLTPSHVDLLCQTSPRPSYDPDVSALLHGFHSGEADVQIVWRAGVPARRRGHRWVLSDNKEEIALVKDLLAIIPPNSLEAISLPLRTLRRWLREGSGSSAIADLSDMEGSLPDSEDKTSGKKGDSREVWCQTPDGWAVESTKDLRPGDIIVVPTVYGGCDEFGFSPESDTEVSDLYDEARKELKREPILVLTPSTLRKQMPADIGDEVIESLWDAVCDSYEASQSDPKALRQELLGALELNAATALNLTAYPATELLLGGKNELSALILRGGDAGPDDLSDEDLSSSYTVPVLLQDHNAAVGQRARALAKSVGLDEHFQETLGRSGDTHDLGKADPRFQRLLGSEYNSIAPGQLLAKGSRRVRPVRAQPGERHEAYSVALLKAYPGLLSDVPDPDLALYLCGAHHGRGRPLMPHRRDEGTYFTLAWGGQRLQFDGAPNLGHLASGWPSLFWRLNKRYGPWGLAYLETLLRLADHLQSRDDIRRGKSNG